ncbi:MAG: DUF4105 domain-containing protein [Duncaniella sp.]|nr:DUF4105 domain-containing protein [Duncaniella sp.]
MMRRIALSLAAMLTALVSLCAVPDSAAVVSLLTCMPGSEIYELEGHSGLRVRIPGRADLTLNWGVFDFNSPGFVYRFVKGETDYMAAAYPTALFLDAYAREGRAVREQVISLTPEQTARLMALADDNLRPDHRVYRYNYILDNCATRPLSLIERAIGDTLRFGAGPMPERAGDTFRQTMAKFHSAYPWYQFGIDTALGTRIDRPMTRREAAFAPVILADMLAGASLPDGSPAVLADSYIVGSADTPSVSEGPTPAILAPMSFAILVLLLSAMVSAGQLCGYMTAARIFDTLWFGACFAAGLVVTFLVFISVHEATAPNLVLLWLNPLCLAGAVAPWLKSAQRLEFCYQSVNFALLIALAAAGVCGVQSLNPAFWPLMCASAIRAAVWLSRPRLR